MRLIRFINKIDNTPMVENATTLPQIDGQSGRPLYNIEFPGTLVYNAGHNTYGAARRL